MENQAVAASSEPAAAPPPQPRLRGKPAAFHRPCYSALPGRPVTLEKLFDEGQPLDFPAKSKQLAQFFSHLFLVGICTPGRDDVVPLSVPAIARSAHKSVRWVYKALHHLSYYGYVYLIPAPGPDGADGDPPKAQSAASKPERVVCLRIPPPGSMPIKTYDPAADASLPPSEDADWSGTASPSQPDDPPPAAPRQLLRRNPPRGVNMRVLVHAARREKGMAMPNLKALEKVPRSNYTVFRRVVTRAVAERFGAVEVDPQRYRMRLPLKPDFFDGDPNIDPLAPFVIERAVDAASRLRFVKTFENAFRLANEDNHDLRYQPKVLMAAPKTRQARLLDVRRYAEKRGLCVLFDGVVHEDFPEHVALGGCLHAPPGICRCGLPGPRPRPRHHVKRHDPAKRVHGVADADLYKLGDRWSD